MVDVSVRAEARKALAQFARLYPKEQRGQVVDIVSAYGVRCILNEVALEQLSPARLAEACEDAISEIARVVDIPNSCMASETRNSRTEERRTALPSAPRQNGVGPAPFNWNSHRRPFGRVSSKTDIALPSP